MTWLTRAAVSRRTVTLLLATALFGAGILAWAASSRSSCPTSPSRWRR